MTSYKQTKEQVLKCYDDFIKIVKKTDKLDNDDKSLLALAAQEKKIREDSFCLMIAGEAKSGKSTFINAYLGKEILPMDVKQCTSSIVEIRYGKEFSLEATYADNRKKKIVGDERIKTFLKENAALDDNFRDIPITLINNEIIVKYKNKRPPEEIIKDLLKGVERENLHKLPPEEYNKKIRSYIKKKQPVWKDIVVKIEIEYPFEDISMKGIRIIDSPGVNAAGRVGDTTASYIESADAIMFLRPITGQAIEANSFKEFLESKSVDRNKNAMFLILTRAASETEATIEEAYREFVKIFGTQKTEERKGVVQEQIIPVDSKAELYFNTFKNLTTEEISTKIKELNAEQKADSFLKAAWFDSDFEKDAFLQELKKISRFETIDQALNRFGRKASYIALSEFLKRIEFVYNKIAIMLPEDISDYKLKRKDPQSLKMQLDKQKHALRDLENKMNTVVDEIEMEYSSKKDKGKIVTAAKEVIDQYKKDVENIKGTGDNSLDELEKLSFRQIDTFKEFQKNLQKKIIKDCNEKLVDVSDKNLIKFQIIEPDFTEEAVSAIKKEMKKKAYVKETYEDGVTFTETKTRSAFSQTKYYRLVRNSINERIESIEQQVVRDLRLFVSGILREYTNELRKNIEKYQKEKEKIEQAQATAEEIEMIINNLQAVIADIKSNIKTIKELKGGIDEIL